MVDSTSRAGLAAEPASPTLDDLIPAQINELRALARRQLSREHERFTLQTTDLIHEAYLRLIRNPAVSQRGPGYFFAAAARAMREVLIDAARRRRAIKRGSGVAPVPLDEQIGRIDAYGDELLALDQALQALEKRLPRAAQVVECRFFGGLTVEDTARTLGISPRTVKSDWALARASLYDSLRDDRS